MPPRLPLYWRVCLINGLVFVVGTAALALSPATVSAQVHVSEAVVLVAGLTVILVFNALLLRRSLAPMDRLIRTMETVELQRPGERLPETDNALTSHLIHGFNTMLDRLETERSASNARALAAQEAERHRIAQELHDEVGQGLTAVLLGLKSVADRAPDDLSEELQAIRETARTSLEEVGHVARRLRPGVLEDLGLLSALASLATEFSSHSGLFVRRGLAPGLPPLPPPTELVIYRVAQEALTNAARHAHADTVQLLLAKHGNVVCLRVADNGRGLGRAVEGAGMRGMRERALLVDGRLTIGAHADGGTEVQLLVPIAAAS